MAITINGSGTVTGLVVGGLPDGTVDADTLATDSVTAVKIPDTVEADLKSGRKNLIINGAMQVAQRGTSATDPVNSTYHTVDRWKVTHIKGGAVDWSQATEAPSDFAYSLKADVTTADTNVASDDLYMVYQIIEDKNVSHLNLGTSDAKTITVSFWVRSSKTGTYCVSLLRAGNYTSEYTINTADTWEQKTVTIPLDITRNWTQLELGFVLMSGSNYHIANETWVDAGSNFAPSTSNQVNFLDNTANEWYITGVQLEVGSSATDFEHRSYGEELALCQRYFQRWGTLDAAVLGLAGQCVSSSTAYFAGQTIIPMRTIPTGSVINVTNFRVRNATSSGVPSITGLTVSTYSETEYMLYASGASGLAAGDASHLLNYNGTNRGYIDFNAEL